MRVCLGVHHGTDHVPPRTASPACPSPLFEAHWVGLAASLFLSGCGVSDAVKQYFGDTDNADPPAELVTFATIVETRELWSASSGSGADEHYLKLTPATAGGRIFTGERAGNVRAISMEDGRVLWRANTQLPISGGIGAQGDLVLVGSSEGDVLALEADTGHELWRGRVSSEVLVAPQSDGEHVIVRAADGNVFCLAADTGRRLWVYSSTVPALTLRGTSAPVVQEEAAIVGFDSGMLAVLEVESGKEIWNLEVAAGRGSSELERMVDIDTQPIVSDGVVYVASFQERIIALEVASGKTLWQRDISTHSNFGMDDSRIYVSDDAGHIWALNRFTGESIWRQESLDARQITAPAVVGDAVVVGDLEGYLHWLNRFTGDFIARDRTSGARILAPPVVVEDVLYVYSSDGAISAWAYEGSVPADQGDYAESVLRLRNGSAGSAEDEATLAGSEPAGSAEDEAALATPEPAASDEGMEENAPR